MLVEFFATRRSFYLSPTEASWDHWPTSPFIYCVVRLKKNNFVFMYKLNICLRTIFYCSRLSFSLCLFQFLYQEKIRNPLIKLFCSKTWTDLLSWNLQDMQTNEDCVNFLCLQIWNGIILNISAIWNSDVPVYVVWCLLSTRFTICNEPGRTPIWPSAFNSCWIHHRWVY